jgi:SPP1 family predicted phage head-tail adaptor
MNPGRLRNLIEIQEKQVAKDPGTKITTENYVTVRKCWAEIQQPYGRKFFEAAVSHLEYAVFFKIRYRKDVKSGMFVDFGGKKYEIEEIKPDLQGKQDMILQCREVQ